MRGRIKDPESIQERMLNGDRCALAESFAEHRTRLWRIVYYRLDGSMNARIDPDDILQDAFLDASLRLPHYSEQKQFSPFVWLRLIVTQTLYDARRRHLGTQQRTVFREVTLNNTSALQSTSPSFADCLIAQLTSPSVAAIRSELADQLRAAIDRLDANDQEVISLRHFEELTNIEVAEVLGIEQKAASIRYVRAVMRLKKCLADVPGMADRFLSH